MTQKSTKHKLSFGVACCRVVPQETSPDKPLSGVKAHNKYQILLVHKRYTYAYSIFVHGYYDSGNNYAIVDLLNNMTLEEKINLLSLNFSQIWYHIWLNSATISSYYMAKSKFESTFLVDNGARLRELISKSRSAGRLWEIPKGRKRNKSESDIMCAVREFSEETGITKKSYSLLNFAKNQYSYIDSNIKYTNIYYIGLAKYDFDPLIGTLGDQMHEISDIRWMDINDVRYVDCTGHLERQIKPILSYVKKYTSRHK